MEFKRQAVRKRVWAEVEKKVMLEIETEETVRQEQEKKEVEAFEQRKKEQEAALERKMKEDAAAEREKELARKHAEEEMRGLEVEKKIALELARRNSWADVHRVYAVLGVSHLTQLSEIASTYRKKSLLCHPDKVPRYAPLRVKQAKEAEFKDLQAAFAQVSTKGKKYAYDVLCRHSPGGPDEIPPQWTYRINGKGVILYGTPHNKHLQLLHPVLSGGWHSNPQCRCKDCESDRLFHQREAMHKATFGLESSAP